MTGPLVGLVQKPRTRTAVRGVPDRGHLTLQHPLRNVSRARPRRPMPFDLLIMGAGVFALVLVGFVLTLVEFRKM